jgi:hypothetical protein
MTDYAKRILDQARETLARTAGITVEHRDHSNDSLTRWRAGMPTERPVKLDDIDQKIAEHNAVSREVVGRALAHERQVHRAAIEEMRKEYTRARNFSEERHRHELAELLDTLRGLLKATEAVDRYFSDHDNKVIDLPSMPLRGGHRG